MSSVSDGKRQGGAQSLPPPGLTASRSPPLTAGSLCSIRQNAALRSSNRKLEPVAIVWPVSPQKKKPAGLLQSERMSLQSISRLSCASSTRMKSIGWIARGRALISLMIVSVLRSNRHQSSRAGS